jgi:hypothetical protein
MFGLIKKKSIIKEFAAKIAELQKKADVYYYIKNDQESSSRSLEQVTPIKNLAISLGICKEVYDEAYKIYDFKNSGKKGYQPNYNELRK